MILSSPLHGRRKTVMEYFKQTENIEQGRAGWWHVSLSIEIYKKGNKGQMTEEY